MEKEFIPVVGDTHALQQKKSPAATWFMDMALENSKKVKDGRTAQGFWVLGHDSTFYGFANNRSVDRVLELMDRALGRYKESPPEGKAPDENAVSAPWERVVKEGTAVVSVFTRIRPVPEGAAHSNRRLGRDHLWVLEDEIESLCTSDVGDGLPRSLALRIARFHLIDNVRGEPDMWHSDQVEELSFEIVARKVEGTKAHLTLKGAFSMASPKCALHGELVGEITLDLNERSLARFRVYAQGQASGEGTWTPGAPEGEFPLRIAMVEAEASSRSVPPQALACQLDYESPAGN